MSDAEVIELHTINAIPMEVMGSQPHTSVIQDAETHPESQTRTPHPLPEHTVSQVVHSIPSPTWDKRILPSDYNLALLLADCTGLASEILPRVCA